MLTLAALIDGNNEETTPVKITKNIWLLTVSIDTSKTGNNVPVVELNSDAAGNVRTTPTAPPTTDKNNDSIKIIFIKNNGGKPSALIVAYSLILSREVMLIVFAITAIIIRMTTYETKRMATTIASVIATNPN
tara:strand:+ start:534 stop:932 length:399 start_codon:yes stop_codon:yes gene_type:complete